MATAKDRMKLADTPQVNGRGVNLAESEAAKRASRLVNERQPTVRTATGDSWVRWAEVASMLGQPHDMGGSIPFSKLEQMRRDPILAFGLSFIKVPLVRAPWYIKSSDPRIAAAVDGALRRIYARFILAYCNSLDYGCSPMVKRFEFDKPDWTYLDNKEDLDAPERKVWTDTTVDMVVWKPFTALNPRYTEPHWTKKGEFNGIDFSPPIGKSSPFFTSGYAKKTGGAGRQPDVPLDWALWATNERDSVFGSLWGYPRIGYAFRFWWAYWYRFALADRAFERWSDPPIIGYHPDEMITDSEGNPVDPGLKILDAAERLRSGANVSLPAGVVTSLDERPTSMRTWALEQMKSETNFNAINEAFEYLDVQKLRAVMVPEQALVEGKGGTSSRNVAATFGDLFTEAQAVIKEEIDFHINRYIIPQFIDVNFGPNAARAEIVTTGFDPGDIETMKEVVRLVGQRDLLREADIKELLTRLGVPTLSYKEMKAREERVAKETEAATPPLVEPTDGKQAGVNEQGLYYTPPEVIVVNVNDKSENDENSDKLQEGLRKVGERLTVLAERDPVINVTVPQPEKTEEKRTKTRKTPVRDEDGNILYVDEQEVDADE